MHELHTDAHNDAFDGLSKPRYLNCGRSSDLASCVRTWKKLELFAD